MRGNGKMRYMKTEIEAKFSPIVPGELLQKLTKLKAKQVQGRTLMKRVLYDKRKNPQIKTTYVRIRDEGDKITMSLKQMAGAKGKVTDQKEHMLIVPDFEEAREFLTGTGLVESCYQEAYRTTWKYKDSEIVMDEFPALAPFLEIESETEEELQEIVKELGLNWKDKITHAVDGIYESTYKMPNEQILESISFITFKQIPKAFRNSPHFFDTTSLDK